MKFKKLFLILIAFITTSLYFSSCFNTLNDTTPIPMPVFPVGEPVHYATLQGRISYEGAAPLIAGTNTASERTAMPENSSSWFYVLQATASGQPDPAPVILPASATTYSYPNLATSSSGIEWTVTVRLKKAATDPDNKTIMIDSYPANLTDDNSVYVHDFMLKPAQIGEGILLLVMYVPSSITSITTECSDTGWASTVISITNTGGSINPVTISANLPSGSYSVRFNFKDSTGLLLYSNKQTINILNNCETNTWVNNGSGGSNIDPINSSGYYEVTDLMIADFLLTTFYVGATPLSSTTGTVAQGYTGTPAAPFSKIDDAIGVIAARNSGNVFYTILVTGSVLGKQTIGSTLNGKAAGITIRGSRGLDSNNLPQDELRLRADNDTSTTGTTLSVQTSVPVTIENLRITKGYTESDYAGGIYIDSDATVKLAGGALVTGNSGKMAGGVYNKGKLFMYDTARIGDTTETLANSLNGGWANQSNNSDSEVAGGIYNVSYGTVYLGYDKFTSDTPPQLHKCTLSGGITRNYKCGIYTEGTIYFDSGNIAYNYSTNSGGGVYLKSDTAKLIMTGGSIANNQAYSYGGGVYITGAGVFDLQKGTLSSNTLGSHGEKGGAVYNYSGTFKLGKEAAISSSAVKNNDIALASGNTVEVNNTLDQTSFALDLTTTARGTLVLTGSKVSDVHSKFSLYNNIYGMGINSEGKIDLNVIVTEIYVNKNAAAANSFEPDSSSYTKNDSTWNNSTLAFNASATSSQNKPFRSIDTALKFITYQASEQDYTIHIVGTYTVASSTEINITNNSSSTNPIKLVKTATQTNPTVTAKSITIDGVTDATNPPIISGANNYRCLAIATEVPVTISNISIINGYFNGNSYGAGITIDTQNGPRKSDVTLSTGAIIQSNSGIRAGAIYNFGTLTIAGAQISDNSATDTSYGNGGAIRNEGGIVNIYGDTTIIGAAGNDTTGPAENVTTPTKKYSNYAGKSGGAIYNDLCNYNGTIYYGEINIGKDAENNYSSPKIEYNYSGSNGGGIYNFSNCIINFYGGSVSYSAAATNGGGIYNEGTLSLKQAARTKTIKKNNASKGGAVYEKGANASFTITPYTSNSAYISIPCSSDSDPNTIYLGTKSGSNPCQITITGLLQYGCDSMRIDTDFSTFKGNPIITTSNDYTPSLNDYNISLGKFSIKQPSGSKYSYFYSSEKLTTDPEICQTSCNYPTLLSNITSASVGDIVMIDGDIIKYEAGLKLGTKKTDAVAIIFHNGTGLGTGTRVLGMAADLSTLENYNWANSNPASDIPALVANVSGTNFSGSGTRFSDGSSNYGYASTNSSSTTFEAMRYCSNYKNYKANLGGTTYESGWYLPSISELYKVYENITTINAVFTNAFERSNGMQAYTFIGGASGIGGAGGAREVPFWSSNTEVYAGSGDLKIWSVYLGDIKEGDTRITSHVYNYFGNNHDGGIVLPIRQFN